MNPPTQQLNGASRPDTIPYAHGAAGHQGISTSTDGTLLIKPCTQAEISFYESAKFHPAFQTHMPVYMGSLRLGDETIQQQVSALQTQQRGEDDASHATSVATQSRSGGAGVGAPKPGGLDRSHRRGTSMGHIVSEPRIARSATKEWTPSGGAKLSSNLSIVLSNATAGFTRPNVIDLKLGSRLWDDDAPMNKRAKLDEVAGSSTSGSLGFRIAGMKVFVGEDVEEENVSREVNTEVHDGYKTYDKFYGRSNINDDNLQSAFDAFLHSLSLAPTSSTGGEKEQRKARLRRKLMLERLQREVSSIEYVLENEESRMYSASILMVYEGDPDTLDSVVKYNEEDGKVMDIEAEEPRAIDAEDDEEVLDDDEDEEPRQKLHEVAMIDFAHAHWTPGQGPDENVLQGIRSIKRILEQLLAAT
ncbi:hypothetical protein LTR70_007854 [Exophiala xenobiotica]|uniref:Kinase n=1 Tax=Lithohypha guttulata TaxID=1690604 RepID=A0ABR0JUT5_9EURO|nr:hypothetical protein LTR24_010161 [Lithohypha guttulata]KAK5313014.1 hypothetical protein LTR70_007854 [Exophiala xenobiotica]